MAPIDPLQCCYREQVAYKLYSAFREPALYRMALSGKWEKIPKRCLSHPKEASFVHKYAPNDTALHRILRTVLRDAPCLDEEGRKNLETLKVQAVEALIKTDQQLTGMRDSFERTPLHLACLNYAQEFDDSLVRLLVQSDPAVLSLQDIEGRTPLHLLLMQGEASPDLVRVMAALGPAAIGFEDAVRLTPLDISMRQNSSIRPSFEDGEGSAVSDILKSVPIDQRPRTPWRTRVLRSVIDDPGRSNSH